MRLVSREVRQKFSEYRIFGWSKGVGVGGSMRVVLKESSEDQRVKSKCLLTYFGVCARWKRSLYETYPKSSFFVQIQSFIAAKYHMPCILTSRKRQRTIFRWFLHLSGRFVALVVESWRYWLGLRVEIARSGNIRCWIIWEVGIKGRRAWAAGWRCRDPFCGLAIQASVNDDLSVAWWVYLKQVVKSVAR